MNKQQGQLSIWHKITRIIVLTFLATILISGKGIDTGSFEEKIRSLFIELGSSKTSSEKLRINNRIIAEFEIFLQYDSSLFIELDSIPFLAQVTSDSGQLRIFTWNVPYEDGTQKYFGFVQLKSLDKYKWYKLEDKSDIIKNPEKKYLAFSNWYGALYYQVIPVIKNGKTLYTLLGFDYNDLFTNKKVIEIMYLSDDGLLQFGMPVFKTDSGLVNRVVFEYSSRVVMHLKYDNVDSVIIFDHLSPSNPRFVGQYRYYGPDFSFDSFFYNDGIWFQKKDIDVRNLPYF